MLMFYVLLSRRDESLRTANELTTPRALRLGDSFICHKPHDLQSVVPPRRQPPKAHWSFRSDSTCHWIQQNSHYKILPQVPFGHPELKRATDVASRTRLLKNRDGKGHHSGTFRRVNYFEALLDRTPVNSRSAWNLVQRCGQREHSVQ